MSRGEAYAHKISNESIVVAGRSLIDTIDMQLALVTQAEEHQMKIQNEHGKGKQRMDQSGSASAPSLT